ncbi:MAG: YaeQ family protein [Pseudomonadales bacterium]|nr:YaeQ family protein [Pseudomonadales bacterium]MCP5215547.1 YaeQ family protein [Pseudomonadales bacterium]
MALKATIFKAEVSIADMDRHYYATHQLTIARHPSETDERMMLRLLAFAMNANQDLSFSKGLSTEKEPELWQKSLSNEILLWIELGQPDEKRIRKACHQAQRVIIYCYGGRAAEIWWATLKSQLTRFENLTIINVPPEISQSLAKMAARTMQLNYSIDEGQISINDKNSMVLYEPEVW